MKMPESMSVCKMALVSMNERKFGGGGGGGKAKTRFQV